MKTLPTDGEIEEAACEDAYEFIALLRRREELDDFLAEHPQRWDDPPRQPVWRALHHLIVYIIRTCEADTAGADNLKLTAAEVKAYLEAHKGR